MGDTSRLNEDIVLCSSVSRRMTAPALVQLEPAFYGRQRDDAGQLAVLT